LSFGRKAILPQATIQNTYRCGDFQPQFRPHQFKWGGEYGLDSPQDSCAFARANGTMHAKSSRHDLVPNGTNERSGVRDSPSSRVTSRPSNGFVQDDWKATQNLTLNLGLRYEITTNARDAKLQYSMPSLVSGRFDFREPKVDKNNFGPRVGFAYSPSVAFLRSRPHVDSREPASLTM